jgi:peptidoglycan-N-acetylglucosamine deacetylase
MKPMPEKKAYMKTNHKIPYLFRILFAEAVFNIKNRTNSLYLTFDDGPHPEYTSEILTLLKHFEAKASFFCIGKNVILYPEVYQEIIKQGHSVGNHSHTHINGFNSVFNQYYNDIEKASKYINSNLFRPPYGNLSPLRYKKLKKEFKVIFWDVMPGDFVEGITADQLTANMISNIKPGSIIVLHDRYIGKESLLPALKNILEHFSVLGYKFCSL